MTGVSCEECGFEYREAEAPAAGAAIRAAAQEVAAIVERGDPAEVRRPPAPEVWSPLEYACHLRDVLLVQRERVLLARRVDEPELTPMGRDERAHHDGYGDQDPAAVARQLRDAALLFSGVLDRLAETDWDRTVVYNYPQPSPRSLRWVAVHTLHEAVHHLGDIHRQGWA